MQHCAHNVYRSLEQRYFKATPAPGGLDFGLVRRIVDDLVERVRPHMQNFDAANFLLRKKGALRRRYHSAYEKLVKNGLDLKRDSKISAFVKNERYFEEGKAPRMIMGRNPIFNILYAQIVEPVESAFFKLEQVANACDFKKCADKFSKLVGEWFMENDMSKYESSQRMFVLQLEYIVYSQLMPHMQKQIDKLFAAKIVKNCTTTTGVNFKMVYGRGSGDMDTSCGNGILNYVSTQYNQIMNFCKQCKLSACNEPNCKTYKFVLKGDDSYASIPTGAKVDNHYKCFGFDAKIVVRQTPESVEFCSGHFIEISPGEWLYVQKLQKLVESLTTCINEDTVRNGWAAHYYRSLGMMYNVLYGKIPVYRDIANFLLNTNTTLGLNINLIQSYNLLDAFNNKAHEDFVVDESLSMLSVSLVNNMDYAELNRISHWFRTHKLSFPPELSKRCNTRAPKASTLPVIQFELLNEELEAAPLDKEMRMLKKQLRTALYHWRAGSSALI